MHGEVEDAHLLLRLPVLGPAEIGIVGRIVGDGASRRAVRRVPHVHFDGIVKQRDADLVVRWIKAEIATGDCAGLGNEHRRNVRCCDVQL